MSVEESRPGLSSSWGAEGCTSADADPLLHCWSGDPEADPLLVCCSNDPEEDLLASGAHMKYGHVFAVFGADSTGVWGKNFLHNHIGHAHSYGGYSTVIQHNYFPLCHH